jgi:zinc protease
VIAEEVAAQRLEPDRVVTAKLFQMAFPHHPYGNDVLGTTEATTQMNRAVVQQFFADQYTPSNATVVIVGDVDPAALVAQVRTAFGVDMTPGSPIPVRLPEPDPPPASRRETMKGEGQEAYLGIAFPAPAVTDPDVHPMDILVTLLEQGTFGRLPAALKGTASGVSAAYETRRQPGLLKVVVSASPAALPRVEETVMGVLRDLASNGPTAAEVLATKSLLAGSYATDNETFAGQANTLGYYASIDRWQFASNYLPSLARVTPEQVRAVAEKYLNPAHAVIAVMLPTSAAPPTETVRPAPSSGLSEARR